MRVVMAAVLLVLLGVGIGGSVRAESENLLANPRFEPAAPGEMPKGWEIVRWGAVGEDFHFEPGAGRDGDWAFRLVGAADRNRGARIHSKPVKVTPGEIYQASVWVRVSEGSGRLYLQFFDARGTRLMTPSTSEPKRSHSNWVLLTIDREAPEDAVTARLSIDSSSTLVDAYFDGAELVRLSDGNGRDEVPGQGDSMEKYTFRVPGAVGSHNVFAINYLENVHPDRFPTSAERCLTTFVAPGEYEPLSFVVYAHQNLSDVEVRVSDLQFEETVIPASEVDIRMVKWLNRRWRYSATPTPGNLEPDAYFLEVYKPFSLPENHFKQIWLTVRVPEGTPPGMYRGYVAVSSSTGDERGLPIVLEVLPFSLRDSEKRLSIYYRNYGQRTEEQRRRDFEDMKAHGLSHVIVRPGLVYRPMPGDGKPSWYWDTTSAANTIRELQELGFEGPYIVISNFDRIPYDEYYVDRLRDAGQAVISLEKELGVEIYLQHMDEVFVGDKRFEYERLTRPAVGIDGLKFYMTMYPHSDESMMEWIDPLVDLRSYHGAATDQWMAGTEGLVDRRTFADVAEYGNPDNDRLWMYYNVWETEMDPRWVRIINGIYFWQSPYEVHGIWAYSEPRGDLFDDTTGDSGTMGMAFIDPRDGSLLSTRHWEAYREGGDDLKYLATLEQLIQEKRAINSPVVYEAELFLSELEEKWWPTRPMAGRRGYSGSIVRALNLENSVGTLQDMRRQVAEYIIKLMNE